MATLYFIVGPTAVGKSELSISWAELNNAEILSCDSLLLYRGMDIGTAKPSLLERSQIVHHGIDQVSINTRYSVHDYLQLSQKVVSDIHNRGLNVVIVGGSGFYLKSFFHPVVDTVDIPQHIRSQVDELYAEKGREGLLEELFKCNPDGTGKLAIENPRRVINALLRCLASGKTLNQLNLDFAKLRSPFDVFERRVCFLNRSRDDLLQRTRRRVKKMIEDGLIDEVQQLLEQGIDENLSAASAIGYRETIDYLKNGGERTKLEEDIIQNTQGLIKKQLTWFKKQIPIDQALYLQPHENGNPEQVFTNSP